MDPGRSVILRAIQRAPKVWAIGLTVVAWVQLGTTSHWSVIRIYEPFHIHTPFALIPVYRILSVIPITRYRLNHRDRYTQYTYRWIYSHRDKDTGCRKNRTNQVNRTSQVSDRGELPTISSYTSGYVELTATLYSGEIFSPQQIKSLSAFDHEYK